MNNAEILKRAAELLRNMNGAFPFPSDYRQLATELEAMAAQPQQAPDGWQLVPTEPTREMIYAGCDAVMVSRSEASRLYHAMLADAPKWEEK